MVDFYCDCTKYSFLDTQAHCSTFNLYYIVCILNVILSTTKKKAQNEEVSLILLLFYSDFQSNIENENPQAHPATFHYL